MAIKFEPNVPETLALKFQIGKPAPSKFAGGDQVMFTFTDGRVAFVSEDVAAQIDALELSVGEPFTVCRRSGKWQIERANAQQPALRAPAAVMPTSNPTYATQDNRTVPPEQLSMDRALTMFLVMAGRATRETEGVLAAEGGSIHFDQRDVAALATTLFIESAKKGYLSWIAPETAQQYVAEAKIRQLHQTAATSAPMVKKAPQPEVQIPGMWKTRGEMRQTFAQLRELVGEVEYFAVLKDCGVDDAAKFHYLNDATKAYSTLVGLVKAAA